MSNNRLSVFVAPLLFLTLLLLPRPGLCQESANCLACHSSMKGRIKNVSGALVELNVDAEKFNASVHGSLSCSDCHIRFSDNPHTTPSSGVPQAVLSLSTKLSSKFKVDPVAGAACITCHEETYKMVLGSMHGKNIVEKNQTDGALCLDCHGSPHYITPVKEENSPVGRGHQVETCGKCHGDEKIIEKYGLEENVMESFRESFHGRKLHLGHTRAPSCSSCHNAHDIRSKTDPESPVFGKNKLVTCGKCHKGANEKFVPAISHKRPGPIPHYGEKALIILTMGTFAFIVLHVLLEAFSDIRDAIFRKKEEEE
ncbi:MAG: cytochrome c3 family protein [Nitrospirota bacterium]|nr:cytochrome c3 family protein [Nitrospirota bacterium]